MVLLVWRCGHLDLLTITKKMADVHFTKMHCGCKLFQRKLTYVGKQAQERLSLFCQSFLSLGVFHGIFFQPFLLVACNAFW